jgi:hypothetical protein
MSNEMDSMYNVAKMNEEYLRNTPIADLSEREVDLLCCLISRQSCSRYRAEVAQ